MVLKWHFRAHLGDKSFIFTCSNMSKGFKVHFKAKYLKFFYKMRRNIDRPIININNEVVIININYEFML